MQDKQILMRSAEPQSLPYWVTNIPENAFVGISGPSRSIEEARQQAMNSAIGQILQAMGADYQLTHESVLSGNLDQSRHELKERLAYSARWLLDSVQQNARQYAFQETGDGPRGLRPGPDDAMGTGTIEEAHHGSQIDGADHGEKRRSRFR